MSGHNEISVTGILKIKHNVKVNRKKPARRIK
jgi:hypothetical protein